jgi:hypothetical protein
MFRRVVAHAVGLTVALLAVACGGPPPTPGTTTTTTIEPGSPAVTPSVTAQRTTFEGFPVTFHVPNDPVGMIFVFHGSGGSAEFADKIETVDALNRFVAAGYGFVATSSTERTITRRWNITDPSLSTNADLSRLVRLHSSLVATTPLEATTPLFAIGMSNGARFSTLWGESWSDSGFPVRAVWASGGRVAAPVTQSGGLTVPTFFTTTENDTTIAPQGIVDDHAATTALGTPTELRIGAERPLDDDRYRRIPGIDAALAEQIRAAYTATGVWDPDGRRIVTPIEAAVSQAEWVLLPTRVVAAGLADEVDDQTAVLLALHQFSAEFADDAVSFFETHRAG